MKLGIMQPYLFPYVGYFSLIKYTDKWIVFDTVQYIEKGWMNRNQIIHPTKPEATYFIVPLKKHPRETLIKDVEINQNENYIERINGQFSAAYKKRRAPYYSEVMEIINSCFSKEKKSLSQLNICSLHSVCKYLGIPFNYDIFSKMNLDINPVHDAGEWALNISKALHAKEYVNPPGGVDIFDRKKFDDANIALNFLKINFTPYDQKKANFIEGLSILDLMMFNSPEKINEMLDNYILI